MISSHQNIYMLANFNQGKYIKNNFSYEYAKLLDIFSICIFITKKILLFCKGIETWVSIVHQIYNS